LAGVLLSGSVSQSVAHSSGHITQTGGGTVLGATVTTAASFPNTFPHRSTWQMTQGTQSIYHCSVKNGGHEAVYEVRIRNGCRYGLPYLWF
jgi:hypothetical protein